MFLMMALLFVLSLAMGIVAVIAGVGGGVLFVPLVALLFPVHIDFIRGAGLLVALAGSMSAAPSLLTQRLSRLKIAVPMALFGSIGSILGARFGLSLSAEAITLWLGVFMIAVAVITLLQGRVASRSEVRRDEKVPQGFLARRWEMEGAYRDLRTEEVIHWQGHRVPVAMISFIGVGFIGGVFGVGAGWANVPVLTLLMGLPLKLAAATSGLIIIVNSASALSVYLAHGAVEPTVAVPAILGMVIGTRIGARLLGRLKPVVVRVAVITVLLAAGVRTLLGGAG